ncbi:MAG: hypothetical protein R3E62_01165 [Pseudomonadales bacterium]|jgi:hypothetical protein
MLRFRWHWLAVLAVTGLALQEAAAAGFNYRYQDNDGRVHIGYSVPPEYVVNGYEVLNEQGIVVDVVLPKTVLDERAKEMLKQAEERHRHELQAAKDEALLRYYSSAADVERVRERKLQEFDNFIDIQRANINTNRKRVAELQAQAAEMELSGQKISANILQTLDTLEHKIADAQRAIEFKEEEKQRVWLAFELDIERLNELQGNKKEDAQADTQTSVEDDSES